MVASAMERIFTTARGAVPADPLPIFSNYAAAALQRMEGDGYASGTGNARRGWKLVGEEGPELMFFHGGEIVWNARETAAVLRAGSTIPEAPKLTIPEVSALRVSDQFVPENLEGQGPAGAVRFLLDNGGLPATGSPDLSSGADGGGIIVNLNPIIQIEGNASQDTVEQMRRVPEKWVRQILDALEREERGRNRMRRSR